MKNKIITVIEILLLIGLGLVLIINPGDSLYATVRILGVAFLIYGVVNLFKYFTAKDKSAKNVIIGVISLIFGIVVLSGPDFVINIIPIIAGVSIAVVGILGITDALKEKKQNKESWKTNLILSIITVCLGIFIFVDPLETMLNAALLIGIVFIYIAGTLIYRMIVGVV